MAGVDVGVVTTQRLTIAYPGWRRPRRVEVAGLSVGWRLNGAGRLSCRLPATDAHRLPFADLKGKWLRFDGGDVLGVWEGEIEDDPGEVLGGTVELSAASMAAQLGHRTVPRTYRQVSGSAGALAARAVIDAANDTPLWIRRMVVDETGPAQTAEWRGDPVDRVVTGLARNAGAWWTVEPDPDDGVQTFTFRTRFLDRRGTVLLVEGVNVVGGSVRPTISTIVNDLTGVAADRTWDRAHLARMEDGSSIRAYGRRQETRRYPGHTREASLEPAVLADLAQSVDPTAAVSLQLHAAHPIVGRVRQGETARLWSASTDSAYDLDVTGRAYVPDQGTVTVVGIGRAVAA